MQVDWARRTAGAGMEPGVETNISMRVGHINAADVSIWWSVISVDDTLIYEVYRLFYVYQIVARCYSRRIHAIMHGYKNARGSFVRMVLIAKVYVQYVSTFSKFTSSKQLLNNPVQTQILEWFIWVELCVEEGTCFAGNWAITL